MVRFLTCGLSVLACSLTSPVSACEQRAAAEFSPLFAGKDPLAGWVVRQWNDVSQPAEEGVAWQVKKGVLHGSEPRGTWLISEQEYGDFALEFEFKLGARGNSGLALRSPPAGDPAFDGLELQMADLRYNTEANDSELTGGIYRAIAPKKQVYKPEDWNRYEIVLLGDKLRVFLNGEMIHDLDLSKQDQEVKRHDGTLAPPIKDRPKKGRIGFQELSRDGDHVQIKNVRLKVFDE